MKIITLSFLVCNFVCFNQLKCTEPFYEKRNLILTKVADAIRVAKADKNLACSADESAKKLDASKKQPRQKRIRGPKIENDQDRKKRNCVHSQNWRDRKKVEQAELELSVKKLEEEGLQLVHEAARLETEQQQIKEEFAALAIGFLSSQGHDAVLRSEVLSQFSQQPFSGELLSLLARQGSSLS